MPAPEPTPIPGMPMDDQPGEPQSTEPQVPEPMPSGQQFKARTPMASYGFFTGNDGNSQG